MEFRQTGSLLDTRDAVSSGDESSIAPATHLSSVPSPSESARKATNQVWRVQCGDVINRDRCLTVLVEEGDVVLVGPPGETARLSAGQLGELRAALNEAWELSKGSVGQTEGRR